MEGEVMTQSSYSQAMIWCCGSCGFVLSGGQPHMECPMCDSYREVFIDIPQQIESEVRAEFGEEINAAPARAKRRAASCSARRSSSSRKFMPSLRDRW